MARPELQHVTRSPQPRQVRLLETTRRDDLRASRHPRDHHPQGVVTSRRLHLVQVVQHQHERRRARPERRGETRRRASQHGHAETTHIDHQFVVARRHACVRRGQQHEQSRRIIVETVERRPSNATILSERPLCQQRGLSVPRRRGDTDDPAVTRPRRLDQVDAIDQTGTRLRNRNLGVQQHLVDRGRDRPLPARVFPHGRTLTRRGRGYPLGGDEQATHRWAPISRNLRDAADSRLRLDHQADGRRRHHRRPPQASTESTAPRADQQGESSW